jgi:general secretion pathway protein D
MNRAGIFSSAAVLAAIALLLPAVAETPDVASVSNRALAVRASLPPAPEPAESFVNFSFDQVDVPAFVRLVGDLTGRRFVVGEAVKGRITVISPKVSRKDIYPLFVSILESAGCTVMEEGDVSRVVPMPERASPLAPVVGVSEKIPLTGVVTKVFRLQHVSVSDVRRLLESKVAGGKSGAVGYLDETGHIVVTDTAENIRRVDRIIAEVDQPGMSQVTEVVHLKFIGAEDLAQQMTASFAETDSRADALRRSLPAAPETSVGGPRKPTVVASPHSNSILVVGTDKQVQDVKRVIAMMDVDTAADQGRLRAIFLKYIGAKEASDSLNALLGQPKADKDAKATQDPTAITGPRRRRIAIEPNESNNALLIDAMPGDFEVVKKLVEQIDQVPQQVHIEVLIAEVSDSDGLDLGVDMMSMDAPSSVGDTAVQGSSRPDETQSSLMSAVQNSVFPGGLTVGVARGSWVNSSGEVVSGYPAVININAVKTDRRIKIRSNPSLMAQNNKEASVNIVDQIPILKSTVQGAGDTRDILQNIDRVDVGIKLKLTPSIVPGGLVRMVLNPSIEAVTDQGPSGTQFAPTIARRDVSTTVTVPDQQTIVIAGLTREDKVKTVRRIPVLGSIPLLGWLFRHTVDSTEKTNVLIFVTPTIAADANSSNQIRERMEKKTGVKADESD